MNVTVHYTIPKKKAVRWQTADGRSIPISLMTPRHILNVLRCLGGIGAMTIPEYYCGKSRTSWKVIFETELESRRS
jgi:hypothetical protein